MTGLALELFAPKSGDQSGDFENVRAAAERMVGALVSDR
jgi:hypothetical protein